MPPHPSSFLEERLDKRRRKERFPTDSMAASCDWQNTNFQCVRIHGKHWNQVKVQSSKLVEPPKRFRARRSAWKLLDGRRIADSCSLPSQLFYPRFLRFSLFLSSASSIHLSILPLLCQAVFSLLSKSFVLFYLFLSSLHLFPVLICMY